LKAGVSMEMIHVYTLGRFTLQSGNTTISDADNRSRKVWGLLAYLLYHRGQIISQKKLIDLFWRNDSASSNPENALRIMLHRTRTLLDQLSAGCGRKCILYKEGGYMWNPDIPVWMDCDYFDTLCLPGELDQELRLAQALEAISLYQGEFLPMHASEIWVIPICAHFQNRFLFLSQEAITLLCARGRYQEAAAICRKAISTEPYHEPLYQSLMQILAAMGDSKAAAEVYEDLSKRLFDDFGIRPSEDTRAIYRTAAHSPEGKSLPIDEILEHLQEPETAPGAMQCDYDYFKVLCYAESRSLERSGSATHVAILNITSNSDKPLSKRSLNRIMEQFGSQLRLNLRRGDTISQCSVSQYIIMLPNANYENSCMVCRRVIGAFQRAHPHVTANIHFMVRPLTPGICVP